VGSAAGARRSRVSCWRLGADHDTYDVRVHDHAGLVAEPPDRDRDHETDREVDRAQALVHARHAVLHGLLGRGGKDVDPVVVDEEQLARDAQGVASAHAADTAGKKVVSGEDGGGLHCHAPMVR